MRANRANLSFSLFLEIFSFREYKVVLESINCTKTLIRLLFALFGTHLHNRPVLLYFFANFENLPISRRWKTGN